MSRFVEIIQHEVHMAALLFMVIAYILRILWLLRFKAGKEMTIPAGHTSGAVASSLLTAAKPWTIEGFRKNPAFYLQFIVFHLGAAAAIGLTFIIPYHAELLKCGRFVQTMQVILGAAFVVGLFRICRRLADPFFRLISTPDDYFALIMMTAFYAAGIGAVAGKPAPTEKFFLPVFFIMAAFFHFYVPFSKIIHYLYYPFTRYYLGKTAAHRNIGNSKASTLL